MHNTIESVIDFPQESLSPAIWTQQNDGTFALNDTAKEVIQKIVDWATSMFKIPNATVHITGSITSNSYSKNSDVDIHFTSPKFKAEKADEFNKILRKKFDELVAKHPELGSINGVKTEVYMQPNPFQDLMSVGCYDFTGKQWLVGPDFISQDFDPYAEYFAKSMKSVDDMLDNVRSIILQMYELSIATIKSKDANFKKSIGKKLHAAMAKSTKMFDELRKRRSHKSSPKNAEEALKNRDDKDWKIADSAFKLLDKFGYLKVLRQAKDAIANDEQPEEAAQKIIDIVTDKISSKSLDDSEKVFIGKLLEVEQQNESSSSALKIGAIAAMMSIAGLLPSNALAKELKDAKSTATATSQKFNITSPLVKDAIKNASTSNEKVGPMSKANVVNALAQVLWKEARGKKEGSEGRKAVASVVINRTGNDPSYIIDVLKEPYAFSCMNSYKGGWNDNTYVWYVPYNAIRYNQENAKIWNECNQIALDVVDKKFKSTIGNRNSYLNKATADKDAIDSWGKKCDLKVNSHHFGYLPEHDPKYVKPGTMTSWKQISKTDSNNSPKIVIAKSGDTLAKIAKRNSITVSKITELNKDIKDPNKISIGQKIRIA